VTAVFLLTREFYEASPDNTMFFENTGGAPVLYVPQNGYLANATVPGAK